LTDNSENKTVEVDR